MNKGNSMKKLLLLLLLTLSINSLFAQSITVQGVLRDGNNRAVADGDYTLNFSIYSDASSGNHLWPIAGGTSDYPVTVLNGVYNMDLPVGTNIVNSGSELWLEVGVNGSVMDERIRLNLSPYEYHVVNGSSNVFLESGSIGIGTSIPGHLLHIVKTSDTAVDGYAFAISQGSQDNLTISKEGHVNTTGNMVVSDLVVVDGSITAYGGSITASSFTATNSISSFDMIASGNVYADEVQAKEFIDVNTNRTITTPVGSITMFAGAAAPTGWLLCDGSVLPEGTQYDDLLGVLNGLYGTSGGRSKVPDLRGRAAIGKDNMGGSSANRVTNSQADAIGGSSGAETHTLTTAQMPSHNHSIVYGPGSGSINPSAHYTTSHNSNMYTGSAGSNNAHNNMQPYMALNYIIKY
jgi:microcystin-dependent protein